MTLLLPTVTVVAHPLLPLLVVVEAVSPLLPRSKAARLAQSQQESARSCPLGARSTSRRSSNGCL